MRTDRDAFSPFGSFSRGWNTNEPLTKSIHPSTPAFLALDLAASSAFRSISPAATCRESFLDTDNAFDFISSHNDGLQKPVRSNGGGRNRPGGNPICKEAPSIAIVPDPQNGSKSVIFCFCFSGLNASSPVRKCGCKFQHGINPPAINKAYAKSSRSGALCG